MRLWSTVSEWVNRQVSQSVGDVVCVYTHTLSHTHSHTHTLTHTPTHTSVAAKSFSACPTTHRAHSHSHTHSQPHTLSHTHTPLSITLSLTHSTHTPPCNAQPRQMPPGQDLHKTNHPLNTPQTQDFWFVTKKVSNTHSHTLSHSHTAHTLSHSYTLSHSHTITHTLSLTHSTPTQESRVRVVQIFARWYLSRLRVAWRCVCAVCE